MSEPEPKTTLEESGPAATAGRPAAAASSERPGDRIITGSEPPTLDEVPVYFDHERHDRVQDFHRAGIWSEMGGNFDGVLLRIRPFHDAGVVNLREKAEMAAMAKRGLQDAKKLKVADIININRYAVVNSLMGAKGMLTLSRRRPRDAQPENDGIRTLESAYTIGHGHETFTFQEPRKVTIKAGTEDEMTVQLPELLMLSGDEELEVVRTLFLAILAGSMPMTNKIVAFSQALEDLEDKEIDPLGVDFIFGRHVEVALVG